MAYYPATIFPQQFLTDSSALLSGGTLYAYLSGTTTPTNVYTDSAGTVAGTTITLNARGEPSVSGNVINIWLDEDVAYKFVLKDASSVTKWTVDGIPVRATEVTSYDVKTFGAVGDGVTDDRAAIQSAVDALNTAGGGKLLFTAGTYRVTATVNVYSDMWIEGAGAVLDASDMGENDDIISGAGALGSSILLSADGNSSDSSISLANVTGIADGDLVAISSDALLPAGTYNIAEMNVIKSISGTTVTLLRALTDDYLVSEGAKVQKITPIENVSVTGLKFVGAGRYVTDGVVGQRGVTVAYGRNINVERNSFFSVDQQCVSIDWVDTFSVSHNYIQHENPGATNTTAIQYGITPKGASRGGLIANNHIVRGKHGVIASLNSRGGINRDIIIRDNVIEGTWGGAIATHDNSRDFTIMSNYIHDCARGIDCRVHSVYIAFNRIRRCDTATLGDAIYLSGATGAIMIAHNDINAGRYGVRMYDDGLYTTTVPSEVMITNNRIRDVSQNGIYLEHTENTSEKTRFTVRGNEIQANANADAIYFVGVYRGAVISDNNVYTNDASTAGFGIRVLGGNEMIIQGNVLDKTAGISFGTEPTNSTAPDKCVIKHNTCLNIKSGFYPLSLTTGTNFQIMGNTGDPTGELTIASGAVTVTQPFHFVDTESDAATDDLATINGGYIGQMIVLAAPHSGRTVVLKDGTGNLRLNGDFSLSHGDDTISLMFNGSNWLEVSRSDNEA